MMTYKHMSEYIVEKYSSDILRAKYIFEKYKQIFRNIEKLAKKCDNLKGSIKNIYIYIYIKLQHSVIEYLSKNCSIAKRV